MSVFTQGAPKSPPQNSVGGGQRPVQPNHFGTCKAPIGGLPARMKVLYVTTPRRTGDWLAEAFAADSASRVLLKEVVGESAGLERLRDEVFDAVLLSHEPGELDALDLVEGLRAGGNEEPMI
ncbi:MAG: hypothetical protein GXP28_08205, partial [Planctomycetes bacterium]|nr:hypothetical protein [Planctomycetota bacterium]